MKVIPIGVRILIALPPIKMGTGLIQMPDEVAGKHQRVGTQGYIAAMGSHAFADLDEPPCKIGDKVIISPHAGLRIPKEQNNPGDDNQYQLVMHEDINAVIVEDDNE